MLRGHLNFPQSIFIRAFCWLLSLGYFSHLFVLVALSMQRVGSYRFQSLPNSFPLYGD